MDLEMQCHDIESDNEKEFHTIHHSVGLPYGDPRPLSKSCRGGLDKQERFTQDTDSLAGRPKSTVVADSFPERVYPVDHNATYHRFPWRGVNSYNSIYCTYTDSAVKPLMTLMRKCQ